MFKAAVGQSVDPSESDAVREVVKKIQAKLGQAEPQAGILFCPEAYDHRLTLSAIGRAFPDMDLIGCTTDGILSSESGFESDALVLMVFASDVAEIRAGRGRGTSLDSRRTGREAAEGAAAKLERYGDEKRFAIILTDPLNAGVSELDSGIESVLGSCFPLFGAASSAHSKKRQTFQFYNDEILTDSVVLLLFAGDLRFSSGIQGGHSPMSKKVRVTSAEKNVLYTIEDEPALAYFQRYIGTDHSLFMNYCLAVFEEGREGYYVRSAPFCDPSQGSVTLNGIVPEKALIQIGTADKGTCLRSCQASLQRALMDYGLGWPEAALFFSCAGRKMMMGTRVVQEAEIVKSHLKGIPYAGFYAYGELAPMRPGTRSLFHGTTFVTLLIGTSD